MNECRFVTAAQKWHFMLLSSYADKNRGLNQHYIINCDILAKSMAMRFAAWMSWFPSSSHLSASRWRWWAAIWKDNQQKFAEKSVKLLNLTRLLVLYISYLHPCGKPTAILLSSGGCSKTIWASSISSDGRGGRGGGGAAGSCGRGGRGGGTSWTGAEAMNRIEYKRASFTSC